MMNTDIYIVRNGTKAGPYSLEQINQMIAEGKASLGDMAWHKEITEWMPLRKIEGINSIPPIPDMAPPLPQSKSPWQWPASILATAAFFLFALMAANSFSGIKSYVNPNGTIADQIAGGIAGTEAKVGEGMGIYVLLAVAGLGTSIALSLVLLGKDSFEKWKPKSILIADGVILVFSWILATS